MEDTSAEFGAMLRRLRQKRKMSLADLAVSTGVSRAMLSKVERGEKSPTLSVASRIAQGLNLSLSRLLGSSPAQELVTIVRRADRLSFVDPDSGFRRELLSPALEGAGMEVARHVIPRAATSGELSAYPQGTRKFLLVEAGTLLLRVGRSEVELSEGDSATFDADVRHEFRNGGSHTCSYFLVITRSTNSGG